jgi:hypothetical protein
MIRDLTLAAEALATRPETARHSTIAPAAVGEGGSEPASILEPFTATESASLPRGVEGPLPVFLRGRGLAAATGTPQVPLPWVRAA